MLRFLRRPSKHHVFVIAEFGSNHMGRLIHAIEAIQTARACGADAVKFQLFTLPDILWDDTQGDPRTVMDPGWLPILTSECDAHDIEFMCTPFSVDAVRALDPYVRRWKIGSFEHSREDIWNAVRATGKPIIASAGIARSADESVKQLYCVSKYPADISDIDLHDMYHGFAGISDHTTSTLVPALAVAFGATIVEKHFRLHDTPKESPDYPHSLDPDGLSAMIANIRVAEEVCREKKPAAIPQYANRRQ